MEKHFQGITEIFDKLERIQTHHIASFDTEPMPDLEHQTLEKKKRIESVKRKR